MCLPAYMSKNMLFSIITKIYEAPYIWEQSIHSRKQNVRAIIKIINIYI